MEKGMPRMRCKALAGALILGLTHTATSMSGEGDAKLTTLVNETCAACHGPDGNSVVPNFPSLAGQQKTYLLREMLDYKEGRRHSDVMVPIMTSLNQEDMNKLADYYTGQKPAPATVSKPELLAVGKRVYLEGNTKSGVPSCDGCHEENGEGSKKFPRVAGQHVTYTLDQIAQYATGKRTNGVKVMRTIAERLTKEEAEAVAEYMASLK
jgi:cytochrome c553